MPLADVLMFLTIWGAFMGVGIAVDYFNAKKKPGAGTPGRDR